MSIDLAVFDSFNYNSRELNVNWQSKYQGINDWLVQLYPLSNVYMTTLCDMIITTATKNAYTDRTYK